jgi:5-methylcytosine-specific restriction endonuclease McrA
MKHNHIRRICERIERPPNSVRKAILTPSERKRIWAKTGGTCHVCGGRVGKRWHADHVIPHQLGGDGREENYLPICRECNGLRWSHAPEVMRLIMRLGVYAKHEIRRKTPLGEALIRLVLRRLGSNRQRRKSGASRLTSR